MTRARRVGEVFLPPSRREVPRYLHAHVHGDGGWGLPIEGHSIMFGTALSCVRPARPKCMCVDVCVRVCLNWPLVRRGAPNMELH